MSALIGVNNGSAIHVLTDAAVTRLEDGDVSELNFKQLCTRSGAVVAAMGLWQPVLRFVMFADERTQTFDEIVAAAPELWDEARSVVPARFKNVCHAALLAGWSRANARLEMHILHADIDQYDVFVAGPADSDACRGFLGAFTERFRKDPNAFDARRDGIEFIQEMRRLHPRTYELAQWAAVGGFVTHSVVTRDGLEASVIHEWPDRVGEFIDAGNVGSSVTDRRLSVADPRYQLPRLLEALTTRQRLVRGRDGAATGPRDGDGPPDQAGGRQAG
jgi:hypothetical protein